MSFSSRGIGISPTFIFIVICNRTPEKASFSLDSKTKTDSVPWISPAAGGLALLPCASAFGSGNIPSFSHAEGKAFRHGDIEDVLAEVIKKTGGFLGRGSKFGGLDIKRIYFGNWLRDMSQANDIAGLSKMSKMTILNLVAALGFMQNGYATGEFEVTEERLGVYQCIEHVDNPRGYADDQPGRDARHVDPRLRGPVDPRELEIDPRTGMKNYIANEQGGWPTSTALLRKTIRQCIDLGRRSRNGGSDADTYECYRLLGTLLHTLEDVPAHSNFCELSLMRLGYHQVFPHVGDAVKIQTPAGPAPPLVTGTFGGSDFIHSLLGEATDTISQNSVSDLSKAMDSAKSRSRDGSDSTSTLAKLLFDLPGGSGSNLSREMQGVEDIRTRASNGQMDNMSPQELHAVLWKVLTFRDNVVKGMENTIEKIGLSSVVEKITTSVNAFVFTTIEPLMKPIMSQATQVLGQGSAAVLNSSEQYAVFDNPHASDPTHSFLSKDHFGLILNEPAGQLACIILKHTVNLIVRAWDDTSMNIDHVASDILETFHHPYFYNDSSSIQREMGAYVKSWIEGQSPEDKRYILQALTKDSVRNHKNNRKGQPDGQVGHGCGGQYNSVLMPNGVGAFAQQYIPGASTVMGGVNSVQQTFNSFGGSGGGGQHQGGRRRDVDEYGNDQGPGGFMPPPGPPQGAASDFYGGSGSSHPSHPSHHSNSSYGNNNNSYSSPSSGYDNGPSPGFPQPQSHHQQGGYSSSSYEQPGQYGGMNSSYGAPPPPSNDYNPGGFGQPPPPPQPHYGHQQPPPQQQYGQGNGYPGQNYSQGGNYQSGGGYGGGNQGGYGGSGNYY
ncbi:Het-C domain-containing protein [Sporobolomyces salmoneus]|uniref:Het-C domain-containing protein n=1 Tax=Sporobolomyces salmoneus TaxID=183962 RepID=UPI003177DA5E